MTPIEPGDNVPEDEVMNVVGEDGVSRRYRKRKLGAFLYRNGKPSNDFLQIVIRYMTVIKASCAALAAIGGMFYGLYEIVIEPQQRRMVERVVAEQVAPVLERLDEDEALSTSNASGRCSRRSSS